MPEAGLEPARFYKQQILSLWCLPFHHSGKYTGFVFRLPVRLPSESIKYNTVSVLLYNVRTFRLRREHSLYIPRALCGLSQQIYLYPASAQRGGPRSKHTITNDRRGSGSSIDAIYDSLLWTSTGWRITQRYDERLCFRTVDPGHLSLSQP